MKRNSVWKVLKEKEVFNAKNRFAVTIQKIKLPNGKIVDDYYRINFPESVVIVAQTLNNKIILSRHYLHGFGKESIVLPGGQVEDGETPLNTAKRELLEETGYVSDKWRLLGSVVPHVNQVCGKVHFFFADRAIKIANPSSKDLEEMEIILMGEQEITNAIKDRNIISMGTITALSLAKIYSQRKNHHAK